METDVKMNKLYIEWGKKVAYDFLKNFMVFEDEEKFNRLCQALEDVIRDVENSDGKFSEVEVMQAFDIVCFNQFRDSWEVKIFILNIF